MVTSAKPALNRPALRTFVASVLLISVLWSSLAEAIIFTLNNRANTRISIRVGGGGNNISEVSFAVPAARIGDMTEITGSPQIRFRVEIRASGANPVTGTLSVNSNGTLNNTDLASSSYIEFSEIRWESRDGDIPSGVFTNSPGQDIVAIQSSQRYLDFLTFIYKNTATLEAGTYEGRVIYTFAAP
jgi:hypothetical protein